MNAEELNDCYQTSQYTDKPKEIVQEIKAHVPGMATVVLKNGDVIVLQVVVKEVRRVVGQKDANSKQVYNFEWGVGTQVIERD